MKTARCTSGNNGTMLVGVTHTWPCSGGQELELRLDRPGTYEEKINATVVLKECSNKMSSMTFYHTHRRVFSSPVNKEAFSHSRGKQIQRPTAKCAESKRPWNSQS